MKGEAVIASRRSNNKESSDSAEERGRPRVFIDVLLDILRKKAAKSRDWPRRRTQTLSLDVAPMTEVSLILLLPIHTAQFTIQMHAVHALKTIITPIQSTTNPLESSVAIKSQLKLPTHLTNHMPYPFLLTRHTSQACQTSFGTALSTQKLSLLFFTQSHTHKVFPQHAHNILKPT